MDRLPPAAASRAENRRRVDVAGNSAVGWAVQ